MKEANIGKVSGNVMSRKGKVVGENICGWTGRKKNEDEEE